MEPIVADVRYIERRSRGSQFESVRTLKPGLVVMEACSSAHYWARRFQSLGTEVRLISPQYVEPFVKTNKNDRNDAAAIVEAASRPIMRFVPVKSVEQQDIQAVHRMRAIMLTTVSRRSTRCEAFLANAVSRSPGHRMRSSVRFRSCCAQAPTS